MNLKVILIFSIVIIVAMVGGRWRWTRNQADLGVPDPKVFSKVEVVGESISDIGEMKVADVKSRDFVIKNIGDQPLQITSVSSSCNCTVGQIVYQGKVSREYGMHAPGGFINQIAVGDTAIVRVIYKPYIMPVYGPVTRDVFVGTNDPDNPRRTFTVQTVVK